MDNIKVYYCTTKEELNKLYKESALTLRVSDTDIIPKFIKWIEQYTLVNKVVYVVEDNVMNDFIGNNIYSTGMFVSILLDDIKDYKAIIPHRLKIGARYFDDIVNNDRNIELNTGLIQKTLKEFDNEL